VYKISVRFVKLHEMSVPEFLSATGVYVIWDARARARPRYIGEGNILRRFTDHVGARKFAHPWDGYVAAVQGSTRGVHKEEAMAVEHLLLKVASEIDCIPSLNAHPGHGSVVRYFCKGEQLRVSVAGYDPFLSPFTSRTLPGAKQINVRMKGEDLVVEHEWRMRRLRRPAIGSGWL
jgi:hypothetical protein